MSDSQKEEIVLLSKSKTLFEWTTQKNFIPKVINKASGIYCWDINGHKFIDFSAQALCVNIGHGDKRITKAIINQLKQCAYVWGKHFTTEIRAQLGNTLSTILPKNLTKVSLVSTGTEANEHAIRIAKNYSKKNKIIAQYRSYHGATYGSISVTGDPRRLFAEPIMQGVIHVMNPYSYRCRWCASQQSCSLDCLNYVEDTIILEGPSTIAGIIIEPVTGSNGVIIPPDGYLTGLRYICDKYNILMIVDEVLTGFGRTGQWFAVDHWNIMPDIMTMAKGLTCGYFPLGAIAVSNKIADYFESNTLGLGSTYNSHPVGCAVALECLKIYQSDNLVQNAAYLGKLLSQELHKIKSRHLSVGDVRSIGLLGVIEFVRNKNTKEPLVPYNASSEELKQMQEFKNYLYQKGLLIATSSNFVLIAPPLCITRDQMLTSLKLVDEAITIIDQCIT